MCEQGNTVVVEIAGVPCDIDSCIVSLVKALNGGGFETVACCCGHGKVVGNIALRDGRELFIAPSYEKAREMDGI